MAKGLIEEQDLKDIANAIRTKNGENMEYSPSQMDEKILALSVGTDTTDANATRDDVVYPYTAYVNGVKLTGTIPEVGENNVFNIDANEVHEYENSVDVNGVFEYDRLFRVGSNVNLVVDKTLLATAIGLKPEKIKRGESILGVIGTYDGE